MFRYIQIVKVRQDHEPDEYLDAWKKAQHQLQRQAGSRKASISCAAENHRVLLIIEKWIGHDSRNRAMEALDEAARNLFDQLYQLGESTSGPASGEWFELATAFDNPMAGRRV